jgi:hypothetical protein
MCRPHDESIVVTETRSPSELVQCTRCKEHPMLDVIMLAIGLGFFALSVGYTIACDRL